MCKMDHYSLKAPLEQTLYTVLNCVAGRATGRKGGWEYQPFQQTAGLFTNMFHARVSQVRVSLFCAAILVTNVDIKSLIVGDEAPMPTHTSPPPTYIKTTKPFSTPLIWYTDRFKVPTYDPTTSFSESSAVKTVYVLDYVLDRPNAGIPRSKAPAKPPRRPLQTGSTLVRFFC